MKNYLRATLTLQKNFELQYIDTTAGSSLQLDKYGKVNIHSVLKRTSDEFNLLEFEYVYTKDKVLKIQKSLLEAAVIETKTDSVMEELRNNFRWTDWEKNKYRDGFTINNQPWYIRTFTRTNYEIDS